MKLFKTIFAVFLINSSVAQTPVYVSEAEYLNMKQNNALTGNEVPLTEGMINPNDYKGIIYQTSYSTTKAYGCSGYTPPPGPGLPVTGADDGWLDANPLQLPFNFCFFGQNFTEVWMNNNGNISFEDGISSFTSSAFPSTGNKMIAAFWADVHLSNTMGTGTATIHATIFPTYAVFNWVNVGYYTPGGGSYDKLNTFQIIISDGLDPIISGGNVALHYGDMQWTTGSASGGVNGFAGTPATVGANAGNNIDFFQIGRFDHAGTDYDGPAGINDGVSYLDNKSFFFDFCSVGNIPPVPTGVSACDTLYLCGVDDTLNLDLDFLSPEGDQLTSITYSSTNIPVGNLNEISNTFGNVANLNLNILAAGLPYGTYDLTVIATDDYITPGITSTTYTIVNLDPALGFPIVPNITFTAGCAPVTFSLSETGYDSYNWSPTNSTTATTTINTIFNDTLSVIIENNGCLLKVDTLIEIPSTPFFNFITDFTYCSSQGFENLYISDSALLSTCEWVNLANPGVVFSTNYSANLQAGTYQVTMFESTGVCSRDTTFTITESVSPQIFVSDTACDLSYQVAGTIVATSGIWSSSSSNISFNNQFLNNPIINSTISGNFNVSFTDNTCGETVTSSIYFAPIPILPADTAICDSSITLSALVSDPSGGIWTVNSSNVTISPNNTANSPVFDASVQDIYTITYTDNICSNSDNIQVRFNKFPEIFNDTDACNYSYFVFNTISENGGVWSSADTNITFLPNPNVQNPQIQTSTPGTYTVTYTDNSCNIAVSSTINFINWAWTILPNDTTVCINTPTVLTAWNPSQNETLSWNTGETSESITVTSPGLYIVTVENVCNEYSDSITVLTKICDIVAPNVMVLSSQLGNNIFQLDYSGLKEFKCTIKNRWGNTIHEYTNPANAWDGKDSDGKIVEEGVYFYIIKAVLDNDEELIKQGSISLYH